MDERINGGQMSQAFEPVFSQEQLDAMCRGRDERIVEAVVSGDVESAKEIYRKHVSAVCDFCHTYLGWVALTYEWLFTEHGTAAGVAGVRPERIAEFAIRSGMSLEDVLAAEQTVAHRESAVTTRMEDAIGVGDVAEIKGVWLESERLLRLAFDFRREVVSDVLGYVYHEHGVAGLEAAMRHAFHHGWWEQGLSERAKGDPVEQIEETIAMLITGFCEVEAVERPDRWTIRLLTCGSCGRQLRDRYADDAWRLEIVREDGPATFYKGALTPYQTHIAFMHHMCAIELLGAPSPPFRCSGLEASTKPCELNVFKRMDDTTSEFYESVGMTKV
jgi:hypothetical protein